MVDDPARPTPTSQSITEQVYLGFGLGFAPNQILVGIARGAHANDPEYEIV